MNDNDIDVHGGVLLDRKKSLPERYHALFILRSIGSDRAVHWISKCFDDRSALLKHELAYCLGQTNNLSAVPILIQVLADENQEIIVRHEAAEALAAIGSESILHLLKSYIDNENKELSQTCELGVRRLEWIQEQKVKGTYDFKRSPYNSIDPAPPAEDENVDRLGKSLIDSQISLFERYKAMFALRNMNTEKSIKLLAQGLFCGDSALLRHEIAYTLGQVSSPVAFEELLNVLENENENSMVRHECAEAIGSIGTPECEEVLRRYLADKEDVVRESCIVALHVSDHMKSDNDFVSI